MQPPDLYAAHAETIESALTHACRAHRLARDSADEFRSWARLRLLDHDQAILRKFRHRSQLRTFLVTVVQRLYLDWRNAEWGKWRPSADARRVGAVAIELERLVLRDELSYAEALQTLVSRGMASAHECHTVWAQLPRRARRHRVDEAELQALPSPSRASHLLEEHDERSASDRLALALDRALGALPESDQVMLRMRYWSGLTIARIATIQGESPKVLYRHFERLTVQLRRELEAQGVDAMAVMAFTSRFADAPTCDQTGNSPLGPSTLLSAGSEHV